MNVELTKTQLETIPDGEQNLFSKEPMRLWQKGKAHSNRKGSWFSVYNNSIAPFRNIWGLTKEEVRTFLQKNGIMYSKVVALV